MIWCNSHSDCCELGYWFFTDEGAGILKEEAVLTIGSHKKGLKLGHKVSNSKLSLFLGSLDYESTPTLDIFCIQHVREGPHSYVHPKEPPELPSFKQQEQGFWTCWSSDLELGLWCQGQRKQEVDSLSLQNVSFSNLQRWPTEVEEWNVWKSRRAWVPETALLGHSSVLLFSSTVILKPSHSQLFLSASHCCYTNIDHPGVFPIHPVFPSQRRLLRTSHF